MSNHQMAQHSRGTSRMNRDARRMFLYNQRYSNGQCVEEKEEVEPELYPPQVQKQHSTNRSQQRAAAWRKSEAMLYSYIPGPIPGSIPVPWVYGQNYDFSSFPLLCESTYKDLVNIDRRLIAHLPFSIFLHGCNMALNARLLLVDQDNIMGLGDGRNAETILNDITLPGPIAEYLSKIGKTICDGHTVALNFPEAGIPLSDKGEKGGTFGELTAENHNAYECYVSPRVTRRRVEAFLAGNADWTPLDPALLPAGFVANENFLGYGNVEFKQSAIIEAMSLIKFPSDTKFSTFATRIQYSPQIVTLMNSIYHIFKGRYQIGPAPVKCSIVSNSFGCIEVREATPNDVPLAKQNAVLLLPSSHSLTLKEKNMSYLYGFICKRTLTAPGLCGTINGKPPDGWIETRNYNLECVGTFALTVTDRLLESWTNNSFLKFFELRAECLRDFCKSNFRILKRN